MILLQSLVLGPPWWPFASRLQLCCKKSRAAAQRPIVGLGIHLIFERHTEDYLLKGLRQVLQEYDILFLQAVLESPFGALPLDFRSKKEIEIGIFVMLLTLVSANMSSLHLTESPARSACD